MYCPKCSQQQLTDEVCFCSRCGFQLGSVSQLLRTGESPYTQTKEKLPLIKRPELRKAAKRVFISFGLLVLSFPLMGIIDPHFPLASPFIIGIAFITFLFALLQMIYYVLFGETLLPIKTQHQSFAFIENQYLLNCQSAQNALFETRSFETAEFVQPPSVAEPTADLIKNKEANKK